MKNILESMFIGREDLMRLKMNMKEKMGKLRYFILNLA